MDEKRKSHMKVVKNEKAKKPAKSFNEDLFLKDTPMDIILMVIVLLFFLFLAVVIFYTKL